MFNQFSDEEPGGFYNGVANTSSDVYGGDNNMDEKQIQFYHLSRLMDEHRSLLDNVARLENDLKQSNHETEVWRLRVAELQRHLDGAGITSRSLADNLDSDEKDLIQVESGSESELESEKCTRNDEEDLMIVHSESSSNADYPTTLIQVNSESESTASRNIDEEDLIIMHGESGLNENGEQDLIQVNIEASESDEELESYYIHVESLQEKIPVSSDEKNGADPSTTESFEGGLLHLDDGDCNSNQKPDESLAEAAEKRMGFPMT